MKNHNNKPWETDYLPTGQQTPHWSPNTQFKPFKCVKMWLFGVWNQLFPPKPLKPYLTMLTPLVYPDKIDKIRDASFLEATVRKPHKVKQQIDRIIRKKQMEIYCCVGA